MPPTKYRADFPERALDLMREGASICEVAAELGISEETIHVWKRDGKHKAFTAALARGTALSQAWWERLGRNGAASLIEIQPAIFNMKNRFGWTDKRETELSGKGGGPIPISWPLPKTELDD